MATRTGLKEPVLACFSPQHRLFYGGAVKNSYQPEQLLYMNDPQGKWTGYPVDQEDELTAAKQQMRSNFDKLR